MAQWPTGSWEAAPGMYVHPVVLRDLPPRRDTLLLRLQGMGKTYVRAVHDLHALPSHAWEATLAIPLLLAFRVNLPPPLEEGPMNQTNEL